MRTYPSTTCHRRISLSYLSTSSTTLLPHLHTSYKTWTSALNFSVKWSVAMHSSVKISCSNILTSHLKGSVPQFHAQPPITNSSPPQTLTYPFKCWHTPDGSNTNSRFLLLLLLLCFATTPRRSLPACCRSSSSRLPLTLSPSSSLCFVRETEYPFRGKKILSYKQRHSKTVEPNCRWSSAELPADGWGRGRLTWLAYSLHHSSLRTHTQPESSESR